jgi:hypothetical protein
MFLDRDPYIRVWRPIYQRLGPAIRRVRVLFSDPKAEQLKRIELRLAGLEAAAQQSCSALEQVLVAVVQDRRVNAALEMCSQNAAQWRVLERSLEQVLVAVVQDRRTDAAVALLEKAFAEGLAAQTAQVSSHNAAQWTALEQLVIAVMGSSTRQSLDSSQMYRFSDQGTGTKARSASV